MKAKEITTYYLDQLHVKSEYRLQWGSQMPFDISNEGGQSTTFPNLDRNSRKRESRNQCMFF